MLAILLLAAEKHQATFIAPIGIGLALFVAELLGVYYTGGSLNPARSFGPAVVIHNFANYRESYLSRVDYNETNLSDWIYWLGPALGASLAAGFYKLLKVLQYETVLGSDEVEPKAASSKSKTTGDEEKDIATSGAVTQGAESGSKGADGNWQVSGPGLGDLHTAGEYNDVSIYTPSFGLMLTTKQFELAPDSRLMGDRLDYIEHLLERLAENPSPRTRHSDLTYVESGHAEKPHNRSSSRFSEDLRLNPASEERIRSSVGGNRVEPVRRTEPRTAGLPKAELGLPK